MIQNYILIKEFYYIIVTVPAQMHKTIVQCPVICNKVYIELNKMLCLFVEWEFFESPCEAVGRPIRGSGFYFRQHQLLVEGSRAGHFSSLNLYSLHNGTVNLTDIYFAKLL